jgi:hypothetical protein
MKLATNQLSKAELRSLNVGDRLILHWQTTPSTIHHINGVVSSIDRETFRIKYFAIPENKDWETAFFWKYLNVDGTAVGEYSWSFSRP